jgi:predicted RNase H-like HicB family nuclease
MKAEGKKVRPEAAAINASHSRKPRARKSAIPLSETHENDVAQVMYLSTTSLALDGTLIELSGIRAVFDAAAKKADIIGRQVLIVEDEDGWYSATVPSLPGCNSQGKSFEEAVTNIREAVELHLEGYKEHGWPVPEEHNYVHLVTI